MPGTPDHFRIRAVDSSHIADLIRIGEETNLSPWSAQNYVDEIKNPNSSLLVLADGHNTIIGFLVGRFVPAANDSGQIDAEIYNIAVISAQQRSGYGQALLSKFIRLCGTRKVANVWLEVRESNQKAINFYKANRFETVQTRNHFYDHPREHAILMKREMKKAKG